ncbi:MAG: exo-alpha-sialidase [bacterium]|nr:exo-alpha-sialidase [bacterium]
MLRSTMAVLVLAALFGPVLAESEPVEVRHDERQYDPRAEADPRQSPSARSAAALIVEGQYVSVQVNVTGLQQNIVGDAANEPSIAVNPLDPDVKVIGWRQFDNVASNFRQAGMAYTQNGGQSWIFPGSLDAGTFRSDPSLDTDSAGNFYYQSLTGDFNVWVFKSLDGGQTWSLPVPSFGGDKNWVAVDKSGGMGDGHVYGVWQIGGGCCGDRTITRSTDGAQSFEEPVTPEHDPTFGTMTVGPDGTVHASGYARNQGFGTFTVSSSVNAQNSDVVPIFNGTLIDLGGRMVLGGPPNPGGLLGQANVAADPGTGDIYLLASVDPPPFGDALDPLDVHISRSEDGGQTWSAPVRVNDDLPGQGVWHWFGALAVAPNGRIDAIWNDTRNTGSATMSQLFYSSSLDGGDHWSANVAVSPVFDSTIGWPNQDKIGDYYTIVSDVAGADVAYSATFNGEQDVYYLRIPAPDCNGNGVPDDQDVAMGTSPDCNGNGLPDECDAAIPGRDCNANDVPDECDLDGGASDDCNANEIPDECEPDCNANGVADECDITSAFSEDCAPGLGNGLPDECEPDCNGNRQADTCDVAQGLDSDCDADGVPDACEPDCDDDGQPDDCQIGDEFVEHPVSLDVAGAQSAVAADLDGDGDADVVSASLTGNKVAWYENLDGDGSFGPQQVISTSGSGPRSVLAVDLDGDDDADVVAASINDSEITWYENLDGAGGFAPGQIVSTAAGGVVGVADGDLDGDGDADLLSASINDDEVAWYENLDGLGTFGPQRIISSSADGAWTVRAADLDGDDDLDVISGSLNDDTVAWYVNLDGAGNFGGPTIVSSTADGVRSVAHADLDGDGDVDLVSAALNDDSVAWYENLNGLGSFGGATVVDAALDGVSFVLAAELDGDLDVDLLAASAIDGRIVWYENLGAGGAFGPARSIGVSAEPLWIDVAGVDSDEAPDVVVASSTGGSVLWYANILGDCNGNGVPDSCEPDCDANGVTDECEIATAPWLDCNGDGVLDACQYACPGGCVDLDGDGCLDSVDQAPGDPGQCADSDGDTCDDCSTGLFDPANDGADADGDGRCDAGDCDPEDDGLWAAAGPARRLTLSANVLQWQAPSAPGAATLTYDTLRSALPADFVGGGACVETNGSDRLSVDVSLPGPAETQYYLVRSRGDCPGDTGSLGSDSAGAARAGVTCP